MTDGSKSSDKSPDPRDELPLHLPALRAFAISLSRNPTTADDLVQDTIVKAWTRFDSFTLGTNLQAWLFTILRNTYFSSLRKHRREVADP
jgi:RNA polymerase sigma-70 factor, ECF subfamily